MLGFGPLWPTISDRASAQRAANFASRWYIVGAVFTGVLALIAILSGRDIPRSQFSDEIAISSLSILDSALLGFVAYKVRKLSVGWSVAGLALFLFGLLAGGSSPIALIIDFFVFFNLIGGVRASLKWRDLDRLEAASHANAPHPIEPT
jgi:hypothetical protein